MEVVLNHFKCIPWHMTLKTCWKLKIYIFSKIQYGQVVWPVLYFYQSSAKLRWHSPQKETHPIEEVLTAPLHFLFPSPPPSFQSFLIFQNSLAILQAGLARPLLPPNLSPSVQEEKVEMAQPVRWRYWGLKHRPQRAAQDRKCAHLTERWKPPCVWCLLRSPRVLSSSYLCGSNICP